MDKQVEVNEETTEKLGMVSRVIVLSTAVLWAVWDIIPAIWQGRQDTISEQFRNWSQTAWVLPFFWGILTSHFFINVGQPDNYKERFFALVAILIGMIAVNLVTYFTVGWAAPVWFRIAILFVGMVLGVVLWPQSP